VSDQAFAYYSQWLSEATSQLEMLRENQGEKLFSRSTNRLEPITVKDKPSMIQTAPGVPPRVLTAAFATDPTPLTELTSEHSPWRMIQRAKTADGFVSSRSRLPSISPSVK